MFHVGNCTCNGMAVNDGSPLSIELCKGPSLPSCSCTSDQCQVGMKQHLLLRIVVVLWCKVTAKSSTHVWRSVTHTQTYSMPDVLQYACLLCSAQSRLMNSHRVWLMLAVLCATTVLRRVLSQSHSQDALVSPTCVNWLMNAPNWIILYWIIHLLYIACCVCR